MTHKTNPSRDSEEFGRRMTIHVYFLQRELPAWRSAVRGCGSDANRMFPPRVPVHYIDFGRRAKSQYFSEHH